MIDHNLNILNIQVSEHLKKKESTGIDFFDRSLGGGLTPSMTYLISGDPGSGKTTFCMQLADALTKRNNLVAYNSIELSASRLSKMAHDMSLNNGFIYLNQRDTISFKKELVRLSLQNQDKQLIFIVDSISDFGDGSLKKVKEAFAKLANFAEEMRFIFIAISHVTKSGAITGSNALVHKTDVYFHIKNISSNKKVDSGEREFIFKKNRANQCIDVFAKLKNKIFIENKEYFDIEVSDDDFDEFDFDVNNDYNFVQVVN